MGESGKGRRGVVDEAELLLEDSAAWKTLCAVLLRGHEPIAL
jgi:hypothetical protein